MKVYGYIFIFLCFIPLLLFRDFTPNNELKYLSIADEALRNGHFFTFSNHGEIYADKPPLYIWLIMLCKCILGYHSMFILSLFSFIPALIILYIMDKWVKSHLHRNLRISGQLMLITSGLFAGSAIVLRMDMLMCMFIVLALYIFYRLYTHEAGKYDAVYLPIYIFLGIFSKGPVGLLVPLLSISTFLIIKGQFKSFGKYLGWKQWSLLIGLCAIWFSCVYLEGGKTYLNNLLFHQTVNRAVNAFHHKAPIWYYFKTIWYSLAPWVLFYIVLIIHGMKKHLINTDLKKLFLTTITTTFIALSLFSGKLDIYLLPIFPFIAYLSFLIWAEINTKPLRFTIGIPAGILIFTFPAFLYIIHHGSLPFSNSLFIPVAAFILSAASIICIYYLYNNYISKAANSISIGMLLCILIGGFAIPQLNPYIGFQEISQKAKTIAYENRIDNYYYYQLRSGNNMDCFLEKEINPIELSDIVTLSNKQNFILFVKQKDVIKKPELQKIAKENKFYNIGNYSIIIFNLN